jgi:hypothetical protein
VSIQSQGYRLGPPSPVTEGLYLYCFFIQTSLYGIYTYRFKKTLKGGGIMAAKRVTPTQNTKAQKILESKLLAYCAMASGALLAAPPAEAAVVYSGVKNLDVSLYTSGS